MPNSAVFLVGLHCGFIEEVGSFGACFSGPLANGGKQV